MAQTTPKTRPRFENSVTQRPGWSASRRHSGPSGPGPLACSAASSFLAVRSAMTAPWIVTTTRAAIATSIQRVLHVQTWLVM